MILSSQVLFSPKCCRMDLTCSKANLSLDKNTNTQKWRYEKKQTNKDKCQEYFSSSWIIYSLFLPLYLWEELCFEDASGLQCFRNLSSKQESSLGQIYKDVSHNFTKVHAAAHFLISVKHMQAWNVYINRYASMHVCVCLMGILPLVAWIEWELVHRAIVICPKVIKASVVSESSPLHVDAHPSLISLNHLNVPHLLHVTSITAGALKQTDASEERSTNKWISFSKSRNKKAN